MQLAQRIKKGKKQTPDYMSDCEQSLAQAARYLTSNYKECFVECTVSA